MCITLCSYWIGLISRIVTILLKYRNYICYFKGIPYCELLYGKHYDTHMAHDK